MSAYDHLPTDSWWVGVSREDWPAALKKEMDRMPLSPFGQNTMMMTAPTERVDEQRRSQRRREEGTLL